MFLQLKNLTKLFDKNNGVRNFNLNVEEGEFVTILGPSGCGKTTTLNLLGGFLKPDSGQILLDGVDITKLPPEKRPISTVFQSYALFPHMNVIENVAYGIRFYRKEKRKQAMEIAKEYIDIVGLTGYENSRVGNLSGGQQQRVALARSMATNPKILLLDEPLSNLDASLRVRMRGELKELQKRLNITMVFVTHDQSEALCLSDKIVVMDKGDIIQIGTPREVYFYPASQYIASFIGKSNFLYDNDKIHMIRPEDIKMIKDKKGEYVIKDKIFMGQYTEYKIENNKHTLDVNLSGKEGSDFEIGDLVNIEI
ncbi:ABC transporter ATP-binding protein [Tissierella praeacuta]|uniref:ABC transporter ATP-binding protein n=1 Tax=Tissierella praeacuta TaxID=43131 RepID=UPI0028AF84BB|nr:ABC transporter ATP-binding protein [Tissierella praeacuta]